jgi:hypothetical protein
MSPASYQITLAAFLAVTAHFSHADSGAAVRGVCTLPDMDRTWHRATELVPEGIARAEQPQWVGRTELTYRIRLRPCRESDCSKFGFRGWLPVAIPAPARYRVAIDQVLWIDAYGNQGILDGVLCEHSGCAPIRKIVQYDLPAGTHWIAVAGKLEGVAGVLVTRVPDAGPNPAGSSWKH